MRKTTAKRNGRSTRKNAKPHVCPHCGAGADGNTVGLGWDYVDQYWHCVICGYRSFERVAKPKTRAEVVAERTWDEVLDGMEREDNEQAVHLTEALA